MERQIHNVVQGSPEWHALRAKAFTASEAPAMMGISPHTSRSELLRRKATGITPDVDEGTERRFAEGHLAEAAFRPIAEEIIGDELYPVTVTLETEDGLFLASMDGLTIDGRIGWEHKLWNEQTAECIELEDEPPEHHIWQLEHQALVSGAETILFVTSDGTREKSAFCWFRSHPARRKALIEGWRQFAKELSAYSHTAPDMPAPAGKAPELLPAIRIELRGEVVTTNLAEFKAAAIEVFRSVNRSLSSDQDFADAEKTAKWCKAIEERLAAAKQHALSQTADIDRLFRDIDEIAAEARSTRLELEKLVKARKEQIKAEIVANEMEALRRQVREEGAELGEFIPGIPADASYRIAEALKGKKTVSSLKDAASAARAEMAIELSSLIARRKQNLATARRMAGETGMGHLWHFDLRALIDMDPALLPDVLKGRIAEFNLREEERKAEEARKAEPPSKPIQTPAKAPVSAKKEAVRGVSLEDINGVLYPLSIDHTGISLFGFEPGHDGTYRMEDVVQIFEAIKSHVEEAVAGFRQVEKDVEVS